MKRRFAGVVALSVVVAAGGELAADHKDSVSRGMQASNQRRWVEAVRWFRQAPPAARPATGSPTAPTTAQSTPATAAAIKPDPAAVSAAVASAQINLDRAQQQDRALLLLEAEVSQLLPGAWEREYRDSQAAARSTLLSAQSKFDAGLRQSDLVQLGDAVALASSAAQQLDAMIQAATARRDELRKLAASTRRPATISSRGTADSPSAVRVPGSEPAGEANPRTATNPNQPAASSVAAVVGNRGDRSLNGPPGEIFAAAQLFFSAQYQEALTSLAAARYTAGAEAVQTHLFRAAASHALYLVGREEDPTLLQQAAQSVRLCRQLDPQFKPDTRAFSPQFIQFFVKTR